MAEKYQTQKNRVFILIVVLTFCGYTANASDFGDPIFTAIFLLLLVPPILGHTIISTLAISNLPKNSLIFISLCVIICGIFSFATTSTGIYWPAYSFSLIVKNIPFVWYNWLCLFLFILLPVSYRSLFNFLKKNHTGCYRLGLYVAICSLTMIPLQYAKSYLIPFPHGVKELYSLFTLKPIQACLALGALSIIQVLLLALLSLIMFAENQGRMKPWRCGFILSLCTMCVTYILAKTGFYRDYSTAVTENGLDLMLDILPVSTTSFLGMLVDSTRFLEGMFILMFLTSIDLGFQKKWIKYVWLLLGILKLVPMSIGGMSLAIYLIGICGNVMLFTWVIWYFKKKLQSG